MAKVIVVGGGLSGLSAAHTLLERGCNVLVLERNGFFGGNSTKATSGINGSGTNTQAAQEIKDSAKIFFDDTKRSARDLARDDLIKVLTYNSADAVNWLQTRFALDLSLVARLGGHSSPRTHRGPAMFPGMVITYALMDKAEELAETMPERLQIIKKARVTTLLRDGDRVIGVEYERDGQKHQEKGPVILATGGYAADFDSADSLLKKYRPELLDLPTTNGDHCTGDGQKMVINIGGAGIDLEKVQVHPTGLIDPEDPNNKVKFLAAEALRGVGGIILNAKGKRFADELGHRDYVTGRIYAQEPKNEAGRGGKGVRLVLNAAGAKELGWHCHHYVSRGLMRKFANAEALAKEMGISLKELEAEFEDYNKIARGEKKDPEGKKYFPHAPFTTNEELHVAKIEPVLHYTMGGIEIGPESQVMSTDKKPIEGLYASGEIAGGVHGANRLGGSSLLGCVVFGRVAGDSAARYLTQSLLTGKIATERAAQVAGHMLETRVRVNPNSKVVSLDFCWAGEGGEASQSSGQSQSSGGSSAGGMSRDSDVGSTVSAGPVAGTEQDAGKVPKQANKQKKNEEVPTKEISLEEVKANKDKYWIAVNGQVLNVESFLDEHPGGKNVLKKKCGTDASEDYNMFHAPDVINKYGKHLIIGNLAQ